MGRDGEAGEIIIPEAKETAFQVTRLTIVRNALVQVLPHLSPVSEDLGSRATAVEGSLYEIAEDIEPGENPAESHTEIFEPLVVSKIDELLPTQSIGKLADAPKSHRRKLADFIGDNPEFLDLDAIPEDEPNQRVSRKKEIIQNKNHIRHIATVAGLKRLELLGQSNKKGHLTWTVGAMAAASYLRNDARFRIDRAIFDRYGIDGDAKTPDEVQNVIDYYLSLAIDQDKPGWTTDDTYERISRLPLDKSRSIRGLGSGIPHQLFWLQLDRDLENFALNIEN